MKKLSDFQTINATRTSIGEAIDADERSLSDESFDEESVDDSSASLSNQITVKVGAQAEINKSNQHPSSIV